jgi:DNA polymerase V
MDGEIFYAAAQRETKLSPNQDSRKVKQAKFSGVEDGQLKTTMDLNEQLIGNKTSTFFMRVNGDAMIGAGIFNGDLIIVDRSITVSNGRVIIAVLNGEMLIRRFEKNYNKIRLLPDTSRLSAIDVDPSGAEFSIWGVVTYVIHAT